MNQFFIYYAESNIVCFIIFAILLVHDLSSVDRQEKQVKFDYALVSFMLYFISDSIWSAVIAGLIPRNLFTVIFSNGANYFLMFALAYNWLNFVMAAEEVPNRNRPLNKFAVIFPFLINTVIFLRVCLFAPHIIINDALEILSAYNVFMVVVPIIYIIAMLFYTIKRSKSVENPLEKKRHLYIGFFPLIVIAGGVLQMVLLPSTPVFCFSCTILMLIFYIQSLDRQISRDPLTQLNNRGQLIKYISQKSNLYREGRLTYVLMMDINSFKSINDTYGHAEGDRALILISDSLKSYIRHRNMPVFLGRYGGDEFILILHISDKEDISTLVEQIRTQIESECRKQKTPYILSVGIGYDELKRDEQDTIQKCIQRADKKMYNDKQISKNHIPG